MGMLVGGAWGANLPISWKVGLNCRRGVATTMNYPSISEEQKGPADNGQDNESRVLAFSLVLCQGVMKQEHVKDAVVGEHSKAAPR